MVDDGVQAYGVFLKLAGVACSSCIYTEGRVCYAALESSRRSETSHNVDIRTMGESPI